MKDIRTFYKVGSVFGGVIWIAGSLLSTLNGKVGVTLAFICALAASVMAALKIEWMARLNDSFDEMAMTHIDKAKASALTVMHAVVLVIVALELTNITTKWNIQIKAHTVCLFILGVTEIAEGLKFLDLEKNGDGE